jgi:ATP diphosphatase
LRRANGRFEHRYSHLEQALAARGIEPGTAGLELLDQLWVAAKAENP